MTGNEGDADTTLTEGDPTASTPTPIAKTDAPPERMVRHVFWKYPILSVVMLALVAVLAAVVGSPNSARATIAGTAKDDPGGAVLAFTQELDGTASSSANSGEYGMGDPARVFVVNPLRAAIPLLGPITLPQWPTLQAADVQQAVATYTGATPEQQMTWASAYDKALGTITAAAPGGDAMGGMPSPASAKIGSLRGDFGPVPVMVEADLKLAQEGYLEQYLQAANPGHSEQLPVIWLYDHPSMLATATQKGLTDDQWGMVKERGFAVGPWYLAVPSVFHIYFPRGATGQGFLLWNLLFMVLLLFAVPFLPGLRDLPKRLKLYRFIYRYPTPGELDELAFKERHGTTHEK
jgi:hypothetical protein